MSLVAAYAVPHPPLIVPAVGRGEERGIQATIDAYRDVAQRIASHRPDTIIVSSPHAPAYYDYFALAPGRDLEGSMEQFRAPEERIACTLDSAVSQRAFDLAQHAGLPVTMQTKNRAMDHATFVPLYFVNQCYTHYQLVSCGLSGLSAQDHFAWGGMLAQAAEEIGRRTVYIASGDLSHKLKDDGPYGFVPEGPVFDKMICDSFASNDLDSMFSYDADLCETAAECGLRSFQMMAGALDGYQHTGELLSYEGPFGVGYGVAAFEVIDDER